MRCLKRTATILFSCLYLLASSGVLVGQHVCMGRVKEKALFAQQEKQCNMSAEMHQSMKDCCEDEWLLEKVEDDQQASTYNAPPTPNFHLIYEVPYSDFLLFLSHEEANLEVRNTGPPDRVARPEPFGSG